MPPPYDFAGNNERQLGPQSRMNYSRDRQLMMEEDRERILKESDGKGKLIVYEFHRSAPCRFYHNTDGNGNGKCDREKDCAFVHMPEFAGKNIPMMEWEAYTDNKRKEILLKAIREALPEKADEFIKEGLDNKELK